MADTGSGAALERLRWREEILEICFWYQGEGFGELFTPKALTTFLAADEGSVRTALDELVAEGRMESLQHGYAFTKAGRGQAGRMFAESFVDFQRPAHGECDGGCCDGDAEPGEACAHDH